MELRRKIKYKLFTWHRRRVYRKFVSSHGNMEWDYSSVVNLLILKLTFMGLYFAKFGITTDEHRRQLVGSIWEARKNLKQSQRAFDIVEAEAQKAIIAKYGVPFKYGEAITKPRADGCTVFRGYEILSPIENVEEARKLYNSIISKEHETEMSLVRSALEGISKSLWTWWD